ncbi:MAG TPA: RsmE family RNA methyltransferase [Roseiflexaceae bacterium]|nr:RsmE family RNA methyltransferase [Roseiflexaceae bacterium]HMP39617.1 RsmE family RNA methyltransferase [Roseiflexaceae bacterium]
MARRTRATAQSNTYRFFIDPAAIQGGRVELHDADLARQIGVVLRMIPGDRLVLLDGSGMQYLVVLEQVERGFVAGSVAERSAAAGEPEFQLTLYAALIRAERFEWLLQKGTEIGVHAFVPLICEHTISEAGNMLKKTERWQRIIREAAEQSRRGLLPHIHQPQLFADACAAAHQHVRLLLWEAAGATGLRTTLATCAPLAGTGAIFSGPEGGLTDNERRIAVQHGIMPVSLGPRTLRAETAPLAAAAALLCAAGDLGQ